MNKESARQYLPLVQALAEGKIIEHKGRAGWYTADEPSFDFPPEQYRIKAEPREIWVNEYPEGDSHTHFSAESAAQARGANRDAITRRYREVIE